MRTITILLLMLLTRAALADIEVAPQYDPHEPIVATVTITDVPQGAKLRGSFAVEGGSYLPAGENVYHVWAGPGTHKVTAQGVWVLTEDVTIGERTVPVLVDFGQFAYAKTFTVGPEVPPPFPDPQPDQSKRRLVILEESAERTAKQAALWLSLLQTYPDQKILILDDDLPVAAKYLPLAEKVARPALLVLEGDKLIRAIPCPSSAAGVEQEAKR